MRVAVASGKGGTGKTLVATSLAWLLADEGREVTYVDADVEAPNGYLFLQPTVTSITRQAVTVPALLGGSCSGCGRCHDVCAFHAIVALRDRVMVLPELCHSCGACVRACPETALGEVPREIGSIRAGRAESVAVLDGVLDVGEPRAAPLVQALGRLAPRGRPGHVIVDAPPGIACPTAAAMRDADLVVLVTEPTPFGLHDLELAMQLAHALGCPMRAVINRADLGDDRVRIYLDDHAIPVLAEIPFAADIARAGAAGVLAVKPLHWLRDALSPVVRAVARAAEGGS